MGVLSVDMATAEKSTLISTCFFFDRKKQLGRLQGMSSRMRVSVCRWIHQIMEITAFVFGGGYKILRNIALYLHPNLSFNGIISAQSFYKVDAIGNVRYKPTWLERFCQVLLSESKRKSLLLTWVQEKLPFFNVSNFTTCWRDGLVLCALVESVCPDACPNYVALKPSQRVNNCRLGLRLAQRHLRVPQGVITPEEMSFGRSESKVFQLVLIIRHQHGRPLSASAANMMRENSIQRIIKQCSVFGQGLSSGVVNRACRFFVSVPARELLDLVVSVVHVQSGMSSVENIKTDIPSKAIYSAISPRDDKEHVSRIPFYYEFVSDSKIQITYVPRVAGYHTIDVQWQGNNIGDSPHTANIYDAVSSVTALIQNSSHPTQKRQVSCIGTTSGTAQRRRILRRVLAEETTNSSGDRTSTQEQLSSDSIERKMSDSMGVERCLNINCGTNSNNINSQNVHAIEQDRGKELIDDHSKEKHEADTLVKETVEAIGISNRNITMNGQTHRNSTNTPTFQTKILFNANVLPNVDAQKKVNSRYSQLGFIPVSSKTNFQDPCEKESTIHNMDPSSREVTVADNTEDYPKKILFDDGTISLTKSVTSRASSLSIPDITSESSRRSSFHRQRSLYIVSSNDSIDEKSDDQEKQCSIKSQTTHEVGVQAEYEEIKTTTGWERPLVWKKIRRKTINITNNNTLEHSQYNNSVSFIENCCADFGTIKRANREHQHSISESSTTGAITCNHKGEALTSIFNKLRIKRRLKVWRRRQRALRKQYKKPMMKSIMNRRRRRHISDSTERLSPTSESDNYFGFGLTRAARDNLLAAMSDFKALASST